MNFSGLTSLVEELRNKQVQLRRPTDQAASPGHGNRKPSSTGPLLARQAPCTPFCPVYLPSPLCTCLQAVPNPTSLPRRAPWVLTRTCPPWPGLSLLLIYCPHAYFSLTSVSSLHRARVTQPGAALWDPPSTSILGERDAAWTHTWL